MSREPQIIEAEIIEETRTTPAPKPAAPSPISSGIDEIGAVIDDAKQIGGALSRIFGRLKHAHGYERRPFIPR